MGWSRPGWSRPGSAWTHRALRPRTRPRAGSRAGRPGRPGPGAESAYRALSWTPPTSTLGTRLPRQRVGGGPRPPYALMVVPVRRSRRARGDHGEVVRALSVRLGPLRHDRRGKRGGRKGRRGKGGAERGARSGGPRGWVRAHGCGRRPGGRRPQEASRLSSWRPSPGRTSTSRGRGWPRRGSCCPATGPGRWSRRPAGRCPAATRTRCCCGRRRRRRHRCSR